MKVVKIKENSTLKLEKQEIEQLIIIKSKHPELPFNIQDYTVIFKDYIVGEIQLNDTLIRIEPRHEYVGLSHYFEMLLYNNYPNKSHESNSFNLKKGFGLEILVENFEILLGKLISFGLTGVFEKSISKTHNPSGRILFNHYKKQIIPIEGITTERDSYNTNCHANQIILKAIKKCLEIEILNHDLLDSLKIHLSSFQNISDFEGDLDQVKNEIILFNSTNQHYDLTLEYAFKILSDLTLGYNELGREQWNIFLINSNDIFEKYTRNILERNLTNTVTKFSKPKVFATIQTNKNAIQKYYSPDVIIDYINGEARAVFDAKNKFFNPNSSNISDFISVSDIYQSTFYANQLNSKVCGLIYPSNISHEPIELEINGSSHRFFIVSVDFSKKIRVRNQQLYENIITCLKFA
jgi:hypothetical protein